MADENTFGNFNIATQELSEADLAESMLGGSPVADPNDISTITDKPEEGKETPKPDTTKVVEDDIDEDDLAEGLLGGAAKTDPAPKGSAEETSAETTEDTDTASEDDNWYEAHAQDLVNAGIWVAPEGEDFKLPTNDAEMAEAWQKQIQTQANDFLINNILEPHGQEGWEMFDAVFNKGVSPEEYLTRYAKIQSVTNLDLTDAGNQEQVVRQYYTQQGWPADRVNTKIQKLKDSLDLEEEATTAHEILLKHENQELQRVAAQKETERRQVAYQKQQYDAAVKRILADKIKAKEFDGIPINDKMAREIETDLIAEKYENTKTGEKLTEFDKWVLDLRKPENYEQKVKIWALKNLVEKDPTLSTIKRKGITEETAKIFNKSVTREKPKPTTTTKANKFTFGQ